MAQGSWIRRMFEEGAILKKQYGEDKVFDLTLGNPVMEPPAQFKEALKQLAENPVPGMHRYMENAGYAAVRNAIAGYLGRETGFNFTENDIIMTCGAAGGLNVILKTVLNPGEEVIISAPFFPEYLSYIDNHNGVVKVLPTDAESLPRLDSFETGIGPKTRAIILNFPNNPSGAVYSAGLLHQIGAILQKKEAQYGQPIYLISDEAYRKIVFDGKKCPHIWQHYPDSLSVTSHSKDLALPGERIGYIAVHPDCRDRKELIGGFIHCNRILGYVNAPALMQRLVANLQDVSVSLESYEWGRDFLYKNLTAMGYSTTKPAGTFYMFPRSPMADDVAFVRELQKYQVLVVPGSGFGTPGYFRISYCVTRKSIEGAMDGFRKVAQQLGLPRLASS
jgi:aspartate aminotransferase